MKFLGNILTKNKIGDIKLFNVVSEKDKLIEGLPTLIVGNSLTKELEPNYNILNWKIKRGLYWTFGPRERRQAYEQELKEFQDEAFQKFKEKIKYQFVNVYLLEKKELGQFIKGILKKAPICYLYNNMCYIYNSEESVVYGINLLDMEYMGCDIKKFLSYINKVNGDKCIYAKDVDTDVKYFLKNDTYLVPCLIS
jgi:hypothetical protein